jgi:hypothetical protein
VDFEALAARIDAAAPRPSRAKGGVLVPNGVDDQDPGTAAVVQPGRQRSGMLVAGPAQLSAFSRSEREQQHPGCQDDLAVPRPPGPGRRRQSDVRASPAAVTVAGLSGALRPDRRANVNHGMATSGILT